MIIDDNKKDAWFAGATLSLPLFDGFRSDADRRAIEASLAEKIKAAEARIAEIKAKAFADVGAIAEETASALVE